jgi:hypothetical protein
MIGTWYGVYVHGTHFGAWLMQLLWYMVDSWYGIC